ncbi:sugar phosphate isomerase/epimerase [Radiobacillus kanasensis]|uniref:sugar phosphate isomerase/epimerase family protein n=1 Tax=Radiobacillus kanasensis TaxID=2844358 RepID=UPI001E364EFA|nr:sugar phosphate isomerase/epimerase family protein [Radiobacillus kanasensis]UFT99706.1 sugar phosphate isomerase/epimerase [Radiobacillus kanasensis]
MNLYLSSTLCWAYPINDVLRIAKQLEYSGVEVWAEQVWYHDTTIESIIQTNQICGIDISLHAANWDLNITSLNKGIQKQSIREIEKSIVLAQQIGANSVTIHPGKMTLESDWLDYHYQLLIENLQHLAQFSNQAGVELSLELMEPKEKEMIMSPEQINRLLEELPSNVSTTFDAAHVPITEDILDYFKRTNRINKVHVSDSNEYVNHLPLGTGSANIDPFLEELLSFRSPVVIEGFENNKSLYSLLTNTKYLKHFLHKHNSIQNLS